MALLILSFQQLIDINVVMFCAPVLFNSIEFGNNVSLMLALITDILDVFAISVSIYGVDTQGRRALFIESGIQMMFFQVFVF